ncbi:MAG: cyclic nucleotide-binding domain-containing protein [Parvularculaceae bacterium]
MTDLSNAKPAILGAAAFSGLPDGVIDAIAAHASLRVFAPGETILSIGQFDGSEFLVVQSGVLQVARSDQANGAVIIEKVVAGEAFAMALAVVGGDPANLASATVSAEEECIVAFVDAEAFRRLAKQKTTLTRRLVIYFASALAGQTRAGAAESSPEQRIYSALAKFVERDAVTSQWRIPRMPKHRELADRANVDEADAANAVAKLIQSGVARRDYPGLVVDDIGELNKLAS